MKKRLLPLFLCIVLALAMLPAAALAVDFNDSSNYTSSNGDGFTPYGVEWKDGAAGILTFQSQKDSYDNAVFVITLYRDGKQVGTHEESASGGTTHTVKLLDYMPAAGLYEVMVHLSVDSAVKGKPSRGYPYQKNTAKDDSDIVQPGFGSDGTESGDKDIQSDIQSLAIGYVDCTHDLLFEPFDSDCHSFVVDGYACGPNNSTSGAGWSYDTATYTLTLNNFRGTAITGVGALAGNVDNHKTPTLTVVLQGENIITGKADETYGALTGEWMNLMIQGSGSLTLDGEQFGLYCSDNNGDCKAKTLDGGRVTVRQGASLKASSGENARRGNGLTCEELVVESGCTVALTAMKSDVAGTAENLVVRGTLTAQSGPSTYSAAFISAMYCTVGSNVVIKGGKDAASATTVLKTHAPQTSPIYGAVTVLDYDAVKIGPLPYIEFREGGTTAPTTPTEKIAYVQNQTITVDGKPITFQTYALKDAAGNLTNYVKLRDVAYVLNGTAVQFNVTWDGSVNMETGKAYQANGSEMKTPFSGDRAYTDATSPTKVNGQVASLAAITLTDDKGAGYTYYKLRDLGGTLGFQVNWSAEKGITVTTGR